ncbi:hypothetical protein ACIQ7D_26325 [Streptomyces sp. NPDC096310]|uniref:hypothetical protein n=1 Tax=Streptomyces sp. NPDC096310 TaxID=3366082 RepID=UPI00381B0468
MRSTRGGVLRDRNAALALAGVVVSGFGTSAMWLVSGIWVKSLTGSDSLAALTVFAMWAPVLVGPVLGVVADRVRRRPLLIGCQLTLAVLLTALTAVQRETPDAAVGRTVASANTLMYVPNAVALALGAGLVAVVSHTVLLPVAGAAGLLTAGWLLRAAPATAGRAGPDGAGAPDRSGGSGGPGGSPGSAG